MELHTSRKRTCRRESSVAYPHQQARYRAGRLRRVLVYVGCNGAAWFFLFSFSSLRIRHGRGHRAQLAQGIVAFSLAYLVIGRGSYEAFAVITRCVYHAVLAATVCLSDAHARLTLE